MILAEAGAVAGVDVRGSAPGTIETDLLDPVNLVQQVHAVFLSGGSAFGLDVATGVRKYLYERKIGFETRVAKVPIVPGAIIFDLGVGGRPDIWPTADCGYRAALAANDGPVAEGNVGAGAGATVGKSGGGAGSMKGGLGTASITMPDGLIVAAIVAVNAVGDVIDPNSGAVVAGVRTPDGKGLADARKLLREGRPPSTSAAQNTTIGAVATNARLTKIQATKVAQMAHDGARSRDLSRAYDGRWRRDFRACDGKLGQQRRVAHRSPRRRGDGGGDCPCACARLRAFRGIPPRETSNKLTRSTRIAVIPGDGIGQEVIPAALTVLEAVASRSGFGFDLVEFPYGCAYYAKNGRMMAPDAFDRLAEFPAIYFGAVGDPSVPDHIAVWELILPLRQRFDQYVNLRPMRLFPGVTSPLANRGPADIDMICVRENSEGEYAGIGGKVHAGTPHEAVEQAGLFTRHGISRIARYAFELAAKRPRRELASATKSNALQHSMVLWDTVVDEVRKDYPNVSFKKYHVDALAARMVTHPQTLDVIVASNLFGDILTDLGAAISGSLGLAASGNINPEAEVPVDVRADSRLGARHQGEGDRESNRRHLGRRAHARSSRRTPSARHDRRRRLRRCCRVVIRKRPIWEGRRPRKKWLLQSRQPSDRRRNV